MGRLVCARAASAETNVRPRGQTAFACSVLARLIAVAFDGPWRPATYESLQIPRLADNVHDLAADPAPPLAALGGVRPAKGQRIPRAAKTTSLRPYRQSPTKGNAEFHSIKGERTGMVRFLWYWHWHRLPTRLQPERRRILEIT